MTGYTLDPQAAKEASQGGKRITESGKYYGKFTAAWEETYPTGSRAVCLKFECDDGRECGPLTLFTFGKDGNQLYGYKLINAILTCARIRTITPQQGKVTVYDFDAKAEVEKDKTIFPELIGKPIGLLLQEEEYTDKDGYLKINNDGTPKTRMRINSPFEKATELMAVEILDKVQQPKLLASNVAYIAANPVSKQKNAKRPNSGGGQYGGYATDSYTQDRNGHYHAPQNQGYNPAPDDYDSEIPF